MKKFSVIAAIAATLLSASCQKVYTPRNGDGTLSLGEMSLSYDDELITKATSAASGTYAIFVYDANGDVAASTTYAAVKSNDNKISLPAGDYTLVARSTDEDVPTAEFEQPVYGVSQDFSIAAGETTSIGSLTCTLLQCKVTVAYSDEFLATVTGAGSTKVSLTAGYPLEYALNADGTYEQSAGYFAVNGTSMEVVFSGNINGSSAKMTKTFTGIAAKQWRQVKFVVKKNEQGQATFDIVINDLVDDISLNNAITGSEDSLADDPDAPKGDGGITMILDHENGCDAQLTDLENLQIVPLDERKMCIKLRATVPDGVKKFTVDIASTSEAFATAVEAASATHIDLVNPTCSALIFDIVPFPHGPELAGQTDLSFDLSAAQEAIILYPGVHTFTMKITDQNNCSKTIPVVMVVD